MYETFDSDEMLSHSLDRKLREWLKDDGPKQPQRIEISGTTVDTSDLRSRGHTELVQAARAFADSGLLMQAEAAYAAATQGGEPEALLEFGRFMRRTGRLEQAMALNYRIVDDPTLLITDTAEASGLRVRAMSNIGAIRRDLGELTVSLRILREAVQTAETSREPIQLDECYALDNYGWTLMRADQPELALTQFERVDRIRAEFGTADERVQSAINLGRHHLRQGDLTEAMAHFSRALSDLRGNSDQHLLANALAGKAEVLIRLGREPEADEALTHALEVNQTLGNRKGQSIVHGLWARSLLQRDLLTAADPHIDAAGSLTDETGDARGRAVVAWLRADAARRRGDISEACILLAESEKVFEEGADADLLRDLTELRAALQAV
jgi:tetratricopeptide (TPR) repeat protein